MATARIDTLELAQALIRCPSVTPVEGGALDLLQSVLEDLGFACHRLRFAEDDRSEEHTSELQSLMRISYAVFCLKKKKKTNKQKKEHCYRHNQISTLQNNTKYHEHTHPPKQTHLNKH